MKSELDFKSILVTGAAGFIGANLVLKIIKEFKDIVVIGIDNMNDYYDVSLKEMDIYPIYPKMNLSKRMQQAKVCPYLLRNAIIDKPNQAWSIDITYIPIKRGFLYLTAVIDWHSRCIVGWEVDDTLDTRMVINALKKGIQGSKTADIEF